LRTWREGDAASRGTNTWVLQTREREGAAASHAPQKEFLGCRAGAATESRPYRAFNVAGGANFAMVDYKLLDPPDRREKKGLGCYNACFGYLNTCGS